MMSMQNRSIAIIYSHDVYKVHQPFADKQKSSSAGLSKHQWNVRERFKTPGSLRGPMLLEDSNTTHSLQRCDLLTGPQAAFLITLLTILFQCDAGARTYI